MGIRKLQNKSIGGKHKHTDHEPQSNVSSQLAKLRSHYESLSYMAKSIKEQIQKAQTIKTKACTATGRIRVLAWFL